MAGGWSTADDSVAMQGCYQKYTRQARPAMIEQFAICQGIKSVGRKMAEKIDESIENQRAHRVNPSNPYRIISF